MIIETVNFYIALTGATVGGTLIGVGVTKCFYFSNRDVVKLFIRISNLEEELEAQKNGYASRERPTQRCSTWNN